MLIPFFEMIKYYLAPTLIYLSTWSFYLLTLIIDAWNPRKRLYSASSDLVHKDDTRKMYKIASISI